MIPNRENDTAIRRVQTLDEKPSVYAIATKLGKLRSLPERWQRADCHRRDALYRMSETSRHLIIFRHRRIADASSRMQ